MSKKEAKETKKQQRHHGKYVFWRVLIGLLFLATAGIIACSALGVVSWGMNVLWVALIALLGACAIASLIGLQWFGVFLPLAGIATVLNFQTDYLPQIDGQIGALWIVATLLSIGFSILIHKRKWWKQDPRGVLLDDDGLHRVHGNYEEIIDDEDDSNVEVFVKLGSTIKYVNSDNFKYARLTNKLGGMKVYFDNAKIKEKEAVIEFNGNMSGYELYIPRQWRIINEIDVTASGMDEKNPRRYDGKDEKIVRLVGSLTMSGIEITYV